MGVRSLLGLAALATAALLGGCGKSGAGADDPRNRHGGARGDYSYPATDYAEQAPGKPGGTLRIATATDTASLDIHALSHGNVQWLGRLLFDNLVYLDDQGRLTPWLATSWDISPDRKTYTFHLRHGVTFSDGTPFDAEAVRVNLQHMRDPRTKSPLAAAYIAPYESGRIVDSYTFEATLSRPYGPFLDVLAQSWLSLISPKQIREAPKTIASHPIGSGPFVLDSYVRQEGLTLHKRKDYAWSPPYLHHSGPAYIDNIRIDIVPESLARYTGLASGQYDLLADAPPQNATAIRADPRLIFDSRIRTGVPYRAISFNSDRAPFDDVRVRRALAKAVDRLGITRSVFFDENLPTTLFLARTTRYFDNSAADVLKYDPVAANRLLDEAGWTARDPEGYRTKNGHRLAAELLTQESSTLAAINVAVQSDLKKVGFDLRIVQLPIPQLTERRNAGDYAALAGGVWHTNTPDALYILNHSGEITSPKRIGQNVSHLRDATLDGLLQRARESGDEAELKRLYAEAQKRVVDDAPGIPLDENHTNTAYNRRLKGLLFDTSHNTPVVTTAWLDGQ
jgi:peptide/nickel transport system substrate-binding protein